MSHGEDNSLKAVIVAVAVNAFIMVLKFVGWFLTWSPSLLAEAIHSVADVGNQFLLWVGIRQSQKAATPEHPYGWGTARYLWNLKSAMGIFFLGCGVTIAHGIHHAYEHFAHPAVRPALAPGQLDPEVVGLVILLVATLLELYSWSVAFQEINAARGEMSLREYFAEGDDPTGVGVLLEDTAAVAGVLVALTGLGLTKLTGSALFDIAATVVIGALLGWVAYVLARANGRLLIGAAVSKGELAKIKAALEDDEMVQRIVDLKTVVLGQGQVRVKCEVDLHEKLIANRIRDSLKADAARLGKGEEPMRVLVDVVGRSVRAAAGEIQRLDQKVREASPAAAHVDLELISKPEHGQDDG
ncbi:MAG: cation diffusion facilitator family transporter [Planctomycetota bacterium]